VIGKKLTELRNKKGMTQVQAAKKLKIPRSTYSNYELDKREPDFDTAEKIATLFDVTVDELLGRKTKEASIEETEAESKRKKGKALLEKIKEEKLDHTLFLLEQLNKE
jgi:transcriptional regulator with XRE-family HTH domain